MLKLYHHPLSTYSRRVRIALLEKGLEYEDAIVDMPNREHRGESYRALNPYGRVPTLADGDFVLYESTAILRYLEGRDPEPALLPDDLQSRARVDMHMKLCDLELAPPVGQITFPKRFLPEEKWPLEAFAQAREKIERHLAILAQQLEGRTYLVDERYTLAEVCYTPFVAFLPMTEVEPPQPVAAWIQRLLARDSAAETEPPM